LAPDDSLDADAAGVIDGLRSLTPQLVRSGDPGSGAPRDQPARCRRLLVKHLFDKLAALILIVLLAPLLVAIAGAVAATSDGPVLLRECHLGLHGNEFTLFRFRTLACAVWEMPRPWYTRSRDPRCTRFGRTLRAWSLDELPQLWNVLRGEMSLVGPRPQARQQSGLDRAGYAILAEYAQRYRMRPGMTGWAQIHGLQGARRTAESLRRRLSYDIWYIENWSLALKFRILALTPFRLGSEVVA
jgi:lipopolysaccharide/colanic/teichoic acid biosynthesis glycosyltransferase